MMPDTTPRAHIIGVSHDAPLQHHHYVRGYLYACEAEGKSPTTVVSYAENLSRFQALARELGLPSRPQDITRQHVRMFLAHLHHQGNSSATVNDRLAVLRLWFKWLKAEGIVAHDPTEGVGRVRQEKKVLRVLTPTQVKDLLAFRQTIDRLAHAGWAILFAAMATGGVTALLAYYERWWLLPLGTPVIAGPFGSSKDRAV